MNKGWISAHRKLMQKGWYKKSEYVHLWLHLLLKANHEPNEWIYKNETFKVSRGQFITSRKTLVKETGIERNKVERILKTFENEQQIKQQNLYTSRLITIINYDQYQGIEQENEQQVSSERAASEQQVSTNNNDNNENNKKSTDVDALVKKFTGEKDSSIIDVLKKHGIPGNVALSYFQNYDLSYLIRKVWHFRFQIEKKKPNNPIGWFRNLIEYDKFPEPDRFHDWVKEKRNDWKKDDYQVLYRPL